MLSGKRLQTCKAAKKMKPLLVIKVQGTGTAASAAWPGVQENTVFVTARMFTCLRAGRHETTNGIKVCAHWACAAPLVRQVFTQQTLPTSVKTAAAPRQETCAAGGPIKDAWVPLAHWSRLTSTLSALVPEHVMSFVLLSLNAFFFPFYQQIKCYCVGS